MRTISYTANFTQSAITGIFAGLAAGSSGIMVVDAAWATQNQIAIRTSATAATVYTIGTETFGITINSISGF